MPFDALEILIYYSQLKCQIMRSHCLPVIYLTTMRRYGYGNTDPFLQVRMQLNLVDERGLKAMAEMQP